MSQVTTHFAAPTHSHRADAIVAFQRGSDIGPDPPYLQNASQEPRHESAGLLWHENRGKEGRRIIPPGGVRVGSGGEGGFRDGHGQRQQPEGEAAAGLASSSLQASRKTRTGLKLMKDCWGNYLPH